MEIFIYILIYLAGQLSAYLIPAITHKFIAKNRTWTKGDRNFCLFFSLLSCAAVIIYTTAFLLWLFIQCIEFLQKKLKAAFSDNSPSEW